MQMTVNPVSDQITVQQHQLHQDIQVTNGIHAPLVTHGRMEFISELIMKPATL